MKKWIIVVCILSAGLVASSQKLGKFGSDLGMKTVLGKDIRPPYTDVNNYFGFIEPGAKPDAEKGGKKYYYVYIWIPIAAPEIGVRMVSPVPESMNPEGTDIASETFTKNATDRASYFDTWITLERAVNIISLTDIQNKVSGANWVQLGYNDDCSELPAQPSGQKYNSLFRVTSSPGDPLKALTVGLYRIGFTTFKTGAVQGSFVAQIGAPVKLPGIKLSNTIAGLISTK
ncbi:MAG: hypothetical protein IPP72_00950 [Chitinophagaceae bacterium]|nr:hypothetical protein [Chitinophagaceae bacterium]